MDKKDFIEIPFGAKDSELIKFEYTIPEGYEAIIENGKVIVKKMESEDDEDERIRKEIVELERVVKIDAGGYPYIDCDIEFYDYDKDIPLAKEGDKVKIIVVKGE